MRVTGAGNYRELFGGGVQEIQPVPGPYQNARVTYLFESGNVGRTQRMPQTGVVAKNSELISIVFVQAVLCAKPHKTPVILQDGFYRVGTKAIFIYNLLEPELLPGKAAGKDQEKDDDIWL